MIMKIKTSLPSPALEMYATYLAITFTFLSLLFFLSRKRSIKRLPPGSLGLPIIGQSFQLFRAMRDNTGEEWFTERTKKYGPIFKFNLMGTPTVFVQGAAVNKFIYTCDDKTLANQQPYSIRKLVGERSILEMSGEDHKHMRGALMSFLKPEVLKKSVGRIDEEIRIHFKEHWHGHHKIMVMPVMKSLTFNVICSLILGIEKGTRRDTCVNMFDQLIEGVLTIPINLPFTQFNRGLRTRSKLRDIIMELISEKRAQLEKHDIQADQDVITSLLSMRGETNSPLLSDEEIVDNSILIMIAGHDTTSTLFTFLIKLMAENPPLYESVLKEQEEIARGKASKEELLTWDDLAKMKHSWRVATEALRMYPPVFFTFRKVLKDFELGGYTIPKGWQVTWAAYTTHMNESLFRDPLKFDPSRFENQGARPPYSFVAFGGGPRVCPGYEFARIETLTVLHYLVTGFKWKLCLEDNFFRRNPRPIFDKGMPIHIEIKKTRGDAIL